MSSRMLQTTARRAGGRTACVLSGLLAMAVTVVESHAAGPAFAISRVFQGYSLPFQDPSVGRGRIGPRQAVQRNGRSLMMADSYSEGDKVVAKGKVGTLTSYSRSWWTVECEDGSIVKSRAGDLARADSSTKARAKPAAPARKASGTVTRKGAPAETGKGTQRAARTPPAPKPAVQPAAKPASTPPPKQAKISPALQKLMDTNAAPAAKDKGNDDTSVGYPDSLAQLLDDMDVKNPPKGGKKDAPNGGKAPAAYPAALVRVLELSGDIEDSADADADADADASSPGVPAAAVPPALSRVLEAMESGAEPAATGAKTPASPLKAKGGTATRRRDSTTKKKGTVTKKQGPPSTAKYPRALQEYLDLAAAAILQPGSVTSASSAASALKQAPPATVLYPEALERYLSLAAEVAVSTPASNKGSKGTQTTTKKGTRTARRARGTATKARGGAKPGRAVYPAGLVELFEAAERAASGSGGGVVQQADKAILVQYPDALAQLLDLMERAGVPPSVLPPRRAA
jgi:hypothetical protein